MKKLDITGEKYNRLTAIKFVGNNKWGQRDWLFQCDCGKKHIASLIVVRRGSCKSCGCFYKETRGKYHKTHGESNSPSYRAWIGMRARCLNKNNPRYSDYGGRGITICKRWNSFENFYKDMGDRPNGKTLDRRDNSMGYSPDNCRWATKLEQNNNKRDTISIKYNGETLSLSSWARRLGLKRQTLYNRYCLLGWDEKRSIETKVGG